MLDCDWLIPASHISKTVKTLADARQRTDEAPHQSSVTIRSIDTPGLQEK